MRRMGWRILQLIKLGVYMKDQVKNRVESWAQLNFQVYTF